MDKFLVKPRFSDITDSLFNVEVYYKNRFLTVLDYRVPSRFQRPYDAVGVIEFLWMNAHVMARFNADFEAWAEHTDRDAFDPLARKDYDDIHTSISVLKNMLAEDYQAFLDYDDEELEDLVTLDRTLVEKALPSTHLKQYQSLITALQI